MLNEPSEVLSDSLIGQYELLGAMKGHTHGIILPQTVTEEDNTWIRRKSMKNIFHVDNGECSYGFYTSVIEPNDKSAQLLKHELQELMPKGEGELDFELESRRELEFSRRIEELVRDKIFMIGGCSC